MASRSTEAPGSTLASSATAADPLSGSPAHSAGHSSPDVPCLASAATGPEDPVEAVRAALEASPMMMRSARVDFGSGGGVNPHRVSVEGGDPDKAVAAVGDGGGSAFFPSSGASTLSNSPGSSPTQTCANGLSVGNVLVTSSSASAAALTAATAPSSSESPPSVVSSLSSVPSSSAAVLNSNVDALISVGGVFGGGLSSSPPADGDIPNDPGKMFIGGLSWQTTPESIREYFSMFGELAEVMVMKDPATRRSRGFGFITFSDPSAVDKVLSFPLHQLDGKMVEPKVAVPRKTNPKLVMRTKKIFVGGLSATTSLEDVKAYFEQFSKVRDAMLAYDKVTNRHRGFGFVTFDNDEVVDKICEIHFHEINGELPALLTRMTFCANVLLFFTLSLR